MSQSRRAIERAFQAIPPVDGILATAPFTRLAARWGRDGLRRFVQIKLDAYRAELRAGTSKPLEREGFLKTLPGLWAADWRTLCERGTRRVINGTGVLLHTNLGRSTLSAGARKAVGEAARWPVDLELDLGDGKRASRTRKLEQLLRLYTGCAAAYAVNNNAAALTLAVDTLARKRRLIVSRGEQVEIGGSFRLPELLEHFAGKMVEVGTTNRTRIGDYAKAITRKGDVLLKVHRSNFSQSGYVQDTSLEELTALGRERACPVIYDLGSGRFDPEAEWLQEPTLVAGLAAGPDLLTFSGDKVFGGPQAGIILGRATAVASLRKNPLARALRLDKLNIAALLATLSDRLSLDPGDELPTRRLLGRERGELRKAAEVLARSLRRPAIKGLKVEVVDSDARSGGGAAAESGWPSAAIKLELAGCRATSLARLLREARPAVLGTLRQDEFCLDLAAVTPEELPEMARVLRRVFSKEVARR